MPKPKFEVITFPKDLNAERALALSFYSDEYIKNMAQSLETTITKASEAAFTDKATFDDVMKAGGNSIKTAGSSLSKLGSEIKGRIKSNKLDSKKAQGSVFVSKIYLPIPNALTESINHDWNASQGAVAQILNMGIGPDSMPSKIANGLASTMGARNITVNPDYVQMYQGSQPRDLTFEWTFAPKSKEEVETIFKIIRFFKSFSSGNPTTTRAFLLAPLFCEVTIGDIGKGTRTKATDFVETLKIDNMIIKSVSVNYSEGSYMEMFKDGNPKVLVVTLNLTERRVKTAEEWLKDDERDIYHNAVLQKAGTK